MNHENDLSPVIAAVEVTLPSFHDAVELDRQIDETVDRLNNAFHELVGLAALLRTMKETQGYKALHFETFTAYLKTKPFRKTYHSYLLRLGAIEDTSIIANTGMSSSMLIEYLSSTDYPTKVPQVIEATWEQVKDLPVRQARQVLREFVAQRQEDFKKAKKPRPLKEKSRFDRVAEYLEQIDKMEEPDEQLGTYFQGFANEYKNLGFGDRIKYVCQLRKFLKQVT